jgi:hypothetical protein
MSVNTPRLDIISQAAELLADGTIIIAFDRNKGTVTATNTTGQSLFADNDLADYSVETIFANGAGAWARALNGDVVSVSGGITRAPVRG